MTERSAVVTGASRGIGRAIALELARRGHRVAVNYQSSEAAAEEVVSAIRSAGGTAVAIKADVSSAESARELIAAAERELGPIGILVNNAGITRDTLLMRMKDDDWQSVISTNLSSAFYCTKAVIRSMLKERFGRIIAISSVSGLVGNAGQVNYAAAKAGLLGIVKSVAREAGAKGITANAIAPGFIETDMTDKLSEEMRAGIIKNIPAARAGRPEDVAAAAAFLASEEASYINGQVIAVDGGMTM